MNVKAHLKMSRGGRVPKIFPKAESKKGSPFPVTPLDRPAERILFGRRDWTRTNDPHHVKVVL